MTSKRSVPMLAAAWCLGYAVLAVTWAFGVPAFPFGASDSRGGDMGSWFSDARPGLTGVLFGTACLAGAAAAAMVGGRGPAAAGRLTPRRWLAAILIPLSLVMLFVVPDVRVLQNLAYGLRGYYGLVDWPVLNQVLCIGGGVLLAWTAAILLRDPPCDECKRPEREPGATKRWLRIGRWATLVAVLAPLPYGIQRAAWNLGIPLGVSEQFVHDLAADIETKGLPHWVIWTLVLPDFIGALLTIGLVMKWGERFPRFVPFLGGRRVPISLAVVPATAVSIAVVVAGMAIYRFALAGSINGSGVPGLLWLPWGLALGVATLAYAQRRRRVCAGH